VRVDLFDRAQLQAQASFSRFAEQQHPVGGRNMCSSSDPVAHAGLAMCNMTCTVLPLLSLRPQACTSQIDGTRVLPSLVSSLLMREGTQEFR
jgi:hypothetical protein